MYRVITVTLSNYKVWTVSMIIRRCSLLLVSSILLLNPWSDSYRNLSKQFYLADDIYKDFFFFFTTINHLLALRIR